jgi:hypothetical protein
MSANPLRVLRFREGVAGRIHASASNGIDYTLCGLALEGDETEGGFAEMRPVHRGKIVCADCIAIIEHAKSIPAKLYRRVASSLTPSRSRKGGSE